MKFLKQFYLLLAVGAIVASCNDDEEPTAPVDPDASVISGGPFNFIVDGVADNIPDGAITITDSGTDLGESGWVITDLAGEILGLPPSFTAPNFDDAGSGVCQVWYISYDAALTGLSVGNNVSDLDGTFVLSNPINVNRLDAPTLSGGPFDFIVGNGVADNIPEDGITVDGGFALDNQSGWVVTDDQGMILGLPPAFTAVDFDDAGAGECFVWYITYAEGLTGLDVGNNTADLSGTYELSNSITVNRNTGATIEGGPFNFIVDGVADNIPAGGITITDSGIDLGESGWVVTDLDGLILGLPPTFTAPDFDEAGSGVCQVWYLSYEAGLTGLATGNNVADLEGRYALSNPIDVNRLDAPTLAGGPFTFTVGDGEADNIPEGGITVEGGFSVNDQSSWVITDDLGNILGLPPMFTAPDFDDAGEGTCLVWYITYGEGLTGLEVDQNVSGLDGVYELSNSITVERVVAPIISGGPFDFIVEGTADNLQADDITVDNSGTDLGSSGWVVTDTEGNILGLPPTFTAPDFDAAGPGTCLVWYIIYEDGLTGLAMGENTDDLEGLYALSNPVYVNRLDAPVLGGGPFNFTVGDGVADNIPEGGITVTGGFSVNEQSSWVVTDDAGNILGLPGSFTAVDFDGAGGGTCFVWYITYGEGLTGLEVDQNVSGLTGVYELSNSIEVVRTVAP